jgi:hypothetical protein
MPGGPITLGRAGSGIVAGGQFLSVHNQPQANLAVIANAVTAVPDPPTTLHADIQLAARPNPAAGLTRIHFTLARPEPVTLTIHDIAGREVKRLLDDALLPPGDHDMRFDTRALPNGLYLCRLQAGAALVTRKLVIAR